MSQLKHRVTAGCHRRPECQQWRFLLVDDPAIMARMGNLYRQSWALLFEHLGISATDLKQADSPQGQAARSGDYLARHFHDVPLAHELR